MAKKKASKKSEGKKKAPAPCKPKKDDTYEQFVSRFMEDEGACDKYFGAWGRKVAADEAWTKARG